ncbi:MAG: polysaccharide deacetylase family protein [Luteolibacter sp.]
MNLLEKIAAILLALLLPLHAQEEGSPLPTENPDIPDDGVRVTVLGYHDFSEKDRETAMRIRTTKFRSQMKKISQLGIPVIPMADFIAWKKGEKTIPERAIVITIDDGWKSVYTDAFPVLKEFGFPFTLYLYKDYVDGGGKALTTAMIEEMMKNGATIGGHSTTHPFPQTVKNSRKSGAEAFDAFLQTEMGDSKTFLEEKFKTPVTTYAYPGGYFTSEMITKGEELGYTQMFTVQPGKVKRSLPDSILPRYVVLGNFDRIFDLAITFHNSTSSDNTAAVELDYPVLPLPGSIINSRLPEISVDLTTVEDIDPDTLKMQVAGFGEVPANYASAGKKFSWQVNRKLRQPATEVLVTWKDTSGNSADPLRWTFKIDPEAAYMQDQ